ncbi:MAG: hypothetical protein QM844_05735 [Planctomycetota bacterium]|nr:hypothetical protein [Planctomycetota bacterium]
MKFTFTCPECYASLQGLRSRAGTYQTCPSCSATIRVPQPPKPKSVAGQTDRVLGVAGTAGGEYEIRASDQPSPSRDDAAVICPACKTRLYTERKRLGGTARCEECGALVPLVEAAKTQAQMQRRPVLDEAAIGEYGIRTGDRPAQPAAASIPFHCILCDTLLYGRPDQVGAKLTCPDCGRQTRVPPPPKRQAAAVIGAAAGEGAAEYGLGGAGGQGGIAGDCFAVDCFLCHTRLFARADEVGKKIRCPDCGTETVVPPPPTQAPGAVLGALAQAGAESAVFSVRPDQSEPRGASAGAKQKALLIGVNCPVCGTRVQATERQVGGQVRCPDCDSPITVPAPPKDALPQPFDLDSAGEYGVSAPAHVEPLRPALLRSASADPGDDPDYAFLRDIDDPHLRWQLQDRSDELGFLGHPEASRRWLAYSMSGAAACLLPAFALILLGMPVGDETAAVTWFGGCVLLGGAVLVLLGWLALFSVNLLAIVEDTSAGNHVVENWPDGDWGGSIGESFYALNACLVSLIPIAILLQTYPPARPLAIHLLTAGFWLAYPLALLSMLETGSALTPVSAAVWSSLARRPQAWLWFYFRSAGIVLVAVAMYLAFWRHLVGPLALPLLAPVATTFAMVYFRWLGLLGASVREVIEERDARRRERRRE